MGKSYRLELLIRHSNETAMATRRNFKMQMDAVRKSFAFLDHHFRTLEADPKSLARNVKMVLTTRFTNHLFSSLLLCERGLILDAFNCSRTGIETTAFYWLVCLDPDSAPLYEQERSPPPVEVRKRLEVLGVSRKYASSTASRAQSSMSEIGTTTSKFVGRKEKMESCWSAEDRTRRCNALCWKRYLAPLRGLFGTTGGMSSRPKRTDL
jgi:hypothetical protein